MSVTVAIEAARQPEVELLLSRSDEYAFDLYPADSCYLLDVSELEVPGVSMFVARIDGTAAGTAALVDRGDGTAELKRLFVDDSARGKGLAAALLAALETHALDASVHVIQLETGPLSVAAIALYEKHGYTRIPNFGQYVGDPHSYCMEKVL